MRDCDGLLWLHPCGGLFLYVTLTGQEQMECGMLNTHFLTHSRGIINLAGSNPLKNGAPTRTRTADLLITNQLLYQLSYRGTRRSFKRWVSRVQAICDGKFTDMSRQVKSAAFSERAMRITASKLTEITKSAAGEASSRCSSEAFSNTRVASVL